MIKQEDRLQQLEEKMDMMLEESLCENIHFQQTAELKY